MVRERLPEALRIGLETLAGWGVGGTRRDEAAGAALFDASLAIDRYESGRPGPDEACRLGDARVLAMRASHEG